MATSWKYDQLDLQIGTRYYTIYKNPEKETERQTELFQYVNDLNDKMKLRLYKWKWITMNPPEESERLFELWRKVPSRYMEFPPTCSREMVYKDPNKLSPILAVDASPTKGGGVFFDPQSKICLTYSVDFKEDLGLPMIDDPQVFEMFNFMFSLFVFKQKLVNTKYLRVLNDHEKIRKPKGSSLVPTIYRIFDWLETSRKLSIVNDPNKEWKLRPKPEQSDLNLFIKLADCLSKDKIFQQQLYSHFESIYIFKIPIEVLRKFYGYF